MIAISENTPLINIKRALDERFGKDVWSRWEPETLSLEVGFELTQLLVDKLSLLRILSVSPLQAFEDPVLFLHAAEVINNSVADFDSVPHLTLLETAYTVHCIKQLLVSSGVPVEFPEPVVKVAAYILRNEGASEPIPPLDFVPASELSAGQTKEDTDAKKKAVEQYIKHMDSL